MKFGTLLVLASGLAVAGPTLAQEQHRQLGAHEHGRGTLNIAVEGARVSMELEVPGMDIVGFEHPANTKQQKASVEKAKAQLLAPLSLFKLPKSAGCIVAEATAAVESGEHEHEHGKENGASAKGAESNAKANDDEHDMRIRNFICSSSWTARSRPISRPSNFHTFGLSQARKNSM